jgi:RNA polymerase sporulation-specific sigma factor
VSTDKIIDQADAIRLELNELVSRAKSGDNAAKEQLLSRNSPLIKSIIKRYTGKGVPYDDLYQLGCLGFIKALNKYDATFGVKFTTYAVPLILGEVKRFLRDDGTIKVSRSIKGLYVKIKKYLETKSADRESPSLDQLAEHFCVSREEIIYAMEASHLPLSLFDKNDSNQDSGGGLSLAERLPGTSSENLVDNIMLADLLKTLPTRERKIIVLRYFRNQTQSEVAKMLNISQVQVSRIEQKVIASFKEYFLKEEIS